MSWSISKQGTPSEVVEALKTQSEQLSGQSKVEYDAVLPHLIGLVETNYNRKNPLLKGISLSANGHAYTETGSENGEDYSNCNVSIQDHYMEKR